MGFARFEKGNEKRGLKACRASGFPTKFMEGRLLIAVSTIFQSLLSYNKFIFRPRCVARMVETLLTFYLYENMS